MSDNHEAAPFSEFLILQRKGALHDELSEALNRLLGEVKNIGKSGSLTLKIDVAKSAKFDGEVVTIVDHVTVKPPKAERPGAIWFIDDEDNLSRNDPRQEPLFDAFDEDAFADQKEGN